MKMSKFGGSQTNIIIITERELVRMEISCALDKQERRERKKRNTLHKSLSLNLDQTHYTLGGSAFFHRDCRLRPHESNSSQTSGVCRRLLWAPVLFAVCIEWRSELTSSRVHYMKEEISIFILDFTQQRSNGCWRRTLSSKLTCFARAPPSVLNTSKTRTKKSHRSSACVSHSSRTKNDFVLDAYCV